MKYFFAAIVVLLLAFSCKTKNVIDPNTLPKDISLKPQRGVSQEQDSKILQQLRAEIEEMIAKKPCTNVENWRISPIGSKACGGPSSYLAYPVEIEKEILPRIKNYTDLQSDFNKTYGIVSDCAMVMPPSGIRCEDGKAVLINNGGNSSLEAQ